MLCSLHIRDLAVVKALDLEFFNGFTALTGETGAGKSILLTAIGLALGDRADSGYIRPGSAKAEIILSFDLSDTLDAQQWLTVHDLQDEDNQCLIRRVLSNDGRSKAYINDRPVRLQVLQDLSTLLMEIHGQHAHLKLLQKAEQRRLLDAMIGNQDLLDQCDNLYRQWHDTKTMFEHLTANAKAHSDRQDLLKFQITELEQGGVETLDYPALSEEHRIQANIGRILSLGRQQLRRLDEDEQHSVNALLGQSITTMDELQDLSSEFGEVSKLLSDALIQAQESTQILRRRLNNLEADPQHFESLEERLALIHGLAKKHRVPPEKLAETIANLKTELDSIKVDEEDLEKMQQKLDFLQKDYRSIANELSTRRKAGATKLQKKVSDIINQLGMPHGEFSIDVTDLGDGLPRAEGRDQVEFHVAVNPGLPPKAIGKIASGGELSRISLAIQVTAMSGKTTPTMIFDEVDAGIGGGVAEVVGNRLRSLGENKQVFCVTHLAQVAAQCHEHLLVEKQSEKDTTRSQVRPLSKQERKLEIARMLGGIKITDQTLAHAEEMLQWSIK